jgi:hypothetical protein
MRTRDIRQPAVNGGKPCGLLVESKACGETPCPVDCKMTDWQPWSKCSEECGGGTQSRDRAVDRMASFGGAACPSSSQVRKCNVVPCQKMCQTRIGGFSSNFGFADCTNNINKVFTEEGGRCRSQFGKEYRLTSASRGTGTCVSDPNFKGADLRTGSLKQAIVMHKESKRESESLMEADIALSCPVSLNSTLTMPQARAAKPYAVCVTTKQKICSGLDHTPACLFTEKTRCAEVCVRASFCKIAAGQIQQRNHGWRSPGGQVCCFKKCKLPKDWYLEDGSPPEPQSWCHQTHISQADFS